MNSEKLHDALNLIDDELIEETNRRRQKKPVNGFLSCSLPFSVLSQVFSSSADSAS